MEYFVCPKRDKQFDIKDFWTLAKKCSYCGSISTESFFNLVNSCCEIVLDMKNKTFVINGLIYFHGHASREEQMKIKELYDNGILNIKRH